MRGIVVGSDKVYLFVLLGPVTIAASRCRVLPVVLGSPIGNFTLETEGCTAGVEQLFSAFCEGIFESRNL